MENKSTIETYEDKKQRTAVFNLTSDLFAGKVFEDTAACQELCRILLQDKHLVLRNVKTQYVIRNLENHSVELDILAEEISGNLINVELQMYKELAPFKRTRYYLSSIDMSILEKGRPYYELPDVTVIYITHEDFIGGKRGQYIRQKISHVSWNGSIILKYKRRVLPLCVKLQTESGRKAEQQVSSRGKSRIYWNY